jgi:hypothetical protein
MPTTNFDVHERAAVYKRIRELETEMLMLDDRHHPRPEVAKQWEHLLDQIVDLRAKLDGE